MSLVRQASIKALVNGHLVSLPDRFVCSLVLGGRKWSTGLLHLLLDYLATAQRVVVVAIKQRLDRWPLKHQSVFLNLLHVVTFPIVLLVCLCFVKVICVLLRLEGRFYLFLQQRLPVVIFKPDV